MADSHRQMVAIYRCDAVISGPTKFVCGDVKVELFRKAQTYIPSVYQPAVVAEVKDAVYCFPTQQPIHLDSKNQHLVLTAGRNSEADCEEELDRAVALLSAIKSPDLFRTLLFRGWLREPRPRNPGILIKFIKPIEIDDRALAAAYIRASARVSRLESISRDRFDLMSRFVARGLSQGPVEESFIWLWTALEVFPMLGKANIRPISEVLAEYLERESVEGVKEKLGIGKLCGLRGKLVHDGRLPGNRQEVSQIVGHLELVVRAVLRYLAGLPYDGALDPLLNASDQRR